MKISFCTVSMNRLHHLKQTLHKNIVDNTPTSKAVSVEFILLDYNSTDGTALWVQDNFHQFMTIGILKYYRTTQPLYFDRSHSRNMAFQLATGDVVCNIDADNYIGKSFYQYLFDFFKTHVGFFLTPSFSQRDVIGKLCIRKDIFMQNRGYNELMNGYGFEDLEFYARLQKNNIKHHIIFDETFLHAIRHGHTDRFQNEELIQKLSDIYVHQINQWSSNIIFMYNDYTYEKGLFINNGLLKIMHKEQIHLIRDQNFDDNFVDFSNENSLIILEGEWEIGTWHISKNNLILTSSHYDSRFTFDKNNSIIYISGSKKFKKITNLELKSYVILLKTEITNRNILNSVLNNTIPEFINERGFGKGLVNENFSDKTIELI